MATFRLVLPNAPWLACLAELRACYSDALRRAGHACTLADFYLPTGAKGEDHEIAFGAHAVKPPPHCGMIIAQSEHHRHHFTDEYLDTLHSAALVMHMGPFDHSVPFTDELGPLFDEVECPPGIMSAERVSEFSPFHVFPSAFTGGASDFPARDLDVLFYGSITPRRARILESLSAAGIQVTALYGVLGAERDRYIDRAKVVLDLKQDGDEPDDQTRAWWAVSRGACVLSENAPVSASRTLIRICPQTVVEHVKSALSEGESFRSELRQAYAAALGPCDVSPLLAALGLAGAAS